MLYFLYVEYRAILNVLEFETSAAPSNCAIPEQTRTLCRYQPGTVARIPLLGARSPSIAL
jgi:hypothetical protein